MCTDVYCGIHLCEAFAVRLAVSNACCTVMMLPPLPSELRRIVCVVLASAFSFLHLSRYSFFILSPCPGTWYFYNRSKLILHRGSHVGRRESLGASALERRLRFFHLGTSTHSSLQTTSRDLLSPLCKWVGRMCSSTDVPRHCTR